MQEVDRVREGEEVEPEPEALVERFGELNEQLDAIADPVARARAEELVGVVIDLYGEGLRRIFGTLERAQGTEPVREALAADGVVASLMLIHDLYPVGIVERVEEALDSVRPYMASHGGDVELLGVSDAGVARIRLAGSCDGCPASAATLELAIKQALDEHAPDLAGLEVEGAETAAGPALGDDALALPIVQAGPTASNGNGNGAPAVRRGGLEPGRHELPSWFAAAELADLEDGELRTVDVAGHRLLVANVERSLLAFLDRCSDCGGGLGGATLIEGVLCCSDCGRRYYLPRAGRSLDDDGLQLDPVPLLARDGTIKVALPG